MLFAGVVTVLSPACECILYVILLFQAAVSKHTGQAALSCVAGAGLRSSTTSVGTDFKAKTRC